MASKKKKKPIEAAAVEQLPEAKVSTVTTPDSPLYTENEAATYLRLSRTTLIRLRRAGKSHYTRLGNRVFYTREQLDQMISDGGGSGTLTEKAG